MNPDIITHEPTRAVLKVDGNPQILELHDGDHTATPWPVDLFTEENIDSLPDAAEDAGIGNVVTAWAQPVGNTGTYPMLSIVAHRGKHWVSLVDNNVWEPGVSGWRERVTVGTGPAAWVQPTGAHDAYPIGARVTHNGHTWESWVAANVWEPGVYGWNQIS